MAGQGQTSSAPSTNGFGVGSPPQQATHLKVCANAPRRIASPGVLWYSTQLEVPFGEVAFFFCTLAKDSSCLVVRVN